uniref:PHB domain-containing protein n=1 Tax=Glossina brevipalpis TaxID=37001 RepID=A0A1A9WPC5_9MUSC
MGGIHTSGPNEAIIISGGCCGRRRVRTIVGGWTWAWWASNDVQYLYLNVMTIKPRCRHVETVEGVPLNVSGVAQCKFMRSNTGSYYNDEPDECLLKAAEQFLGKSLEDIQNTILQTLEGHLRAILGTLTVEQVYKDREEFAHLVRDVAQTDVKDMGIEILSFTIADVHDEVNYLKSLGKTQTAQVKRDANVGVAESERDAGIREAECEKNAMDIKYETDIKIGGHRRKYQLQKSQFDQEINKAKAEASLAYDLESAIVHQDIRNEELQIDVVERQKQIEIEKHEVQRMEQELIGTVKLPAEAEAYRIRTIAEGEKYQTIELANAVADKIRKIGIAKAYAIEEVGKAEAQKMSLKANVYKKFGDAAITNLVLESLPKIASEVASPLAKTEEIVLIGGSDNLLNDVNRLVAQLPPSINALTGVDISKIISHQVGDRA